MIPAVSAAKGALYRKTMSGGRTESKERFIMDRKRLSGTERTTELREKNVARIEERCRPQEVDRTIAPVSWLHHIAERFTSPRVRYPLFPPKNDRVH
jgi:hypothetical protein